MQAGNILNACAQARADESALVLEHLEIASKGAFGVKDAHPTLATICVAKRLAGHVGASLYMCFTMCGAIDRNAGAC